MTNTLWSLHSKKWIQMSFKCQNENKSQNNITENLHELCLIYYACFPLNLSWAKLFFFFFLVGDSFTWAISAVSNSLPAHPAPSCSVIGGGSLLSVMHGPAHQSKFVVMPLQSDTGGPSVLIQPVRRRRGEGREGVTQGGTKLSPCSSRNISSAPLWQREGFVWTGSPDIFDAKTKYRYTSRRLDFNRWLAAYSKILCRCFYK